MRNKPDLVVRLSSDVLKVDTGIAVYSGTTEYWNSQPDLRTKAGSIYVYTDYKTINGVNVPGLKVGDGNAYLIDAPFVEGNSNQLDEVTQTVNDHIADSTAHVTEEDRLKWDNKVTARMSQQADEVLILTKD